MSKRANLSAAPEALKREGLSESPEPWEDGLRAPTGPGTFEWWYFDAHLDDGSTAVIVFMTKPLLGQNDPLDPLVQFSITRPDGTKISQSVRTPVELFSASRERCYVRSGESWVRGDLKTYELHAKTEDLAAHLTFTGQVPAWRPGAGKIEFSEDGQRYFAWLPAIPYGQVEGRLTYDGKIRTVKGTCYHDHNWGNVALNEVLDHWYWGRAHIADYTLIFVEMTTTKEYGSQVLPVFLLAKGDQILTGNGAPLTLDAQEYIAHPGGRSYPAMLDFHWESGADVIHLALRSPVLLEETSLLALLSPWKRRVAQLLANPYYFRFQAELDLKVQFAGLTDRQKGSTLYELMLLR